MNALMVPGLSVAYGFSVIASFAPESFPGGTTNVCGETAAVSVVPILPGQLLAARAKRCTGDTIHVRPREAVAVDGAVLNGSSDVGESRIKGGPVPGAKASGSGVEGRGFGGRTSEGLLTLNG